MQSKSYFLIFISCVLLRAPFLIAQAEQESEQLSNQESSPLMMFGEAGKKNSSPRETTDPRRAASQSGIHSGITSQDSSSDMARGTFSSLAEEEQEGTLTLDHFQTALAQNPTATRFVIHEDEESGIFIQPRAAGTSKFAISKNDIENKIIIEALRELLLARHAGSAEIVDSFFETRNGSGAMTLSAERLGEILERSNALLKDSQKASSQASSQKTPPFSVSENEETISIDHSNDSDVDDELGVDIRNSIQTLEKITLAKDLSKKADQATTDLRKLQKTQKAERRKQREQKRLADSLGSDTDGYSTGTGLQHAVLRQVKKDLTLSLLQHPTGKKASVAERNIEGYTHLAEEKRTQALAASLAVEKAKKSTLGKGNFEQEKAAYQAAEEAWNDVVIPYENALEVAHNAHLETGELTTLLHAAKANELYWRAHLVALEARKKEHAMVEVPNECQVSELLESWSQAAAAYEAALIKEKEAGLETPKWRIDLTNVQAQQASWESKLFELQDVREKAQEKIHRTKLEALQTKVQQAEDMFHRALTTAQQARDTLEATHWNEAIKAAEETEVTWQEVLQGCQEPLHEAPERFKESWQIELKKATDNKLRWRATIEELKSQQKESIAQAQEKEIGTLQTKVEELKNKTAEAKIQETTAAAAGKIKEGEFWKSIGNNFEKSVSYVNHAIKAIVSDHFEIANLLKEAAIGSEEGAEEWKQGVAALVRGDENEENKFSTGGYLTSSRANEKAFRAFAIEAEQAGKPEVAIKWREAAERQLQAVEYFVKAAQARATGKTEEGNSWNAAGASFYSSAEKQGKAIEAEQAGKPEVAIKWREAAERQRQAVEYHIKAAEAEATEKIAEGYSWHNAALSFYNAAEKQGKAIEAEQAGQPEVAIKWREAAERQLQAVEYFVKGAQAKATGKTEEGTRWHNAGASFRHAAEKQEKAIEAELAGKPEVAIKWREVAERQLQAVEYCVKAAEAEATGKTASEGNRWSVAGNSFNFAAEKQGKAIEAEQAGKPEVAIKWREAAERQFQAVECFVKAAQARATGNIMEGSSWHAAGDSFYFSGDEQENAIEAEQAGKPEIAIKWREAAERQLQAVEYYVKAAQAYATGKPEEGTRWHNLAAKRTAAAHEFVKNAQRLATSKKGFFSNIFGK